MNKALLIFRREFLTTLGRRSFLALTFGVPILAIVVMAGFSLVNDGPPAGGGGSSRPHGYSGTSSVEGYVDQAGLIHAIPHAVLRGHLLPFADEADARAALASHHISAYYLIPADYLEKGKLFYVYPDSRPLTEDGQEWKMVRTLFVNLVGGDEVMAERAWDPIDLEVFDLGTRLREEEGEAGVWERLFPALMVALFFATFMISSSLMSESIAGEKENRTIELLILSANPVQILAGKVAGLGTAALLQTSVWLGAVFLALQLGGQKLRLPESSTFPVALLAWALVFFVLGFAQYASLMAGAGALVSHLKEVSQVTYLILSPLMAGYVVGVISPLAEASQAALPLILSFFPLTSPVVMIMRLSSGPVPWWQLLLSVGLLAASACLILRAVAAMFRAQVLLTGEPFSIRRFLALMVHPSR